MKEQVTVYPMKVNREPLGDQDNNSDANETKRGAHRIAWLLAVLPIIICFAGMLYLYNENTILNRSLTSARLEIQTLQNGDSLPNAATEKIENYINTKHFQVDGIVPPHQGDPFVLSIRGKSQETFGMSDEQVGKEMMDLIHLIRRRFEMDSSALPSKWDQYAITINLDNPPAETY